FLAGSIAINANQTLTITPGTTLRFKNDAYLVAAPNGRLVAEGTPSQPITFTSALTTPAPGSWAFITFNNTATGRLRHCVIQYAGSSTGGAPRHFSLGVGAPTDVEVRHCTIEHGRGVGVLVQETATSPLLDNVTIRNVSDVAIYHQYSPLPTLRYSNLTLTNNGTNAVELPDSATVNKPVTLDSAALGGAFFLAGSIAINANQTLTITPGTTLRFK
ncbi:MAG: right-handed parallel beta-helix repeat-containing protein, partial [Chloroflexota bacterium]|nr:right-handed parallel beta-helix repeat-containing protein [Chloroflexota bacterium]